MSEDGGWINGESHPEPFEFARAHIFPGEIITISGGAGQ